MTNHNYPAVVVDLPNPEDAANLGRPPAPGYQNSVDRGGQEKQLLTVQDAAGRLGVGRTTLYGLLKTGAVESVHIGRLRRVPAVAIIKYTDALRSAPHDADHTEGSGPTTITRSAT